MRKLIITALLLAASTLLAQESFVQLPPNSTGTKLRMRCNTISSNVVCAEAFFLEGGSGGNPLGIVSNPLFVTFTNASLAITASSLPLPSNAAQETGGNLDAIAAAVGRIPTSPATDRATAVAPFSMRLSDGTSFYKATTPSDTQPTSNANIDVALSTVATQATLALIKAKTDNIDVALSTRTKAADSQHVTIDGGSIGNSAFTANAGANLNTSALALDATLTGGTQKTKIVDSGGVNVATVSAAGAIKVDGSAVTQPVSGTVTTTPPANASTNVAQIAGTTADTNSGVKSAGTLRVVLATDQPQLTNKLLVTPDSVALPANQSVNDNQIGGNAILTGNGVTGAGSQRVTIASDQTAFAVNNTQQGTASQNVTQFGGTNVVTGTGTSGAGIPRVTVASDSAITQGTAAASTAPWPVSNGTVAATSAAWTSATTLDTTLALAVTGYGTVVVTNNVSGTVASANLNFESSDDGGTTWRSLVGARVDVANSFTAISTAASTSATITFSVGGLTNFRVRLNPAITNTGTATVRIQASTAATNPWAIVTLSSAGSNLPTNINTLAGTALVNGGLAGSLAVGGTQANGAVITANPVLIGGTDGSGNMSRATVKAASTAAGATDTSLVVAFSPNSPTPTGTNIIGKVTTDQTTHGTTDLVADDLTKIGGTTVSTGQGVSNTGTLRVVQSQELTYSAGLTIKTNTAAGTGPFFSLCGSASTTVTVQRFQVSGTVATAAVWGDVILKKTSAATSGGTATTLTSVPYDSNNAAATAVAKFYTVLATAGTPVGVIDDQTQLFPVTTISATLQPSPAPLVWKWRDPDSQPVVLRGVAQCMEAAFGTTTTNVPTLTVGVVWTEK